MGLIRSLLLWLSARPRIGRGLERLPGGQRLVARFVAGRSHQDAIATAAPLLAAGFQVTFSALGEEVTSAAAVEAAVQEYLALAGAVGDAGIGPRSRIAVKPSLIGLRLDPALAQRNLRRILTAATAASAGVELDMEHARDVDATLALYRASRADGLPLGVALQAALRRTGADLDRLLAEGWAHVRLVKGAYRESPAQAHSRRAEIDHAYQRLLARGLTAAPLPPGTHIAIASHDERLIGAARSLAARGRVPAAAWEIQMLYGVRRGLQERLRREGAPVRVYLPYGQHWYPYFLRRMAEHPANLRFVLLQLVRP